LKKIFSRKIVQTRYEPLRRPQDVQFVDLHCHCLPELDDGPQNMIQALALARALAADGIHNIIATPHQLGRYEGRNSPGRIRRAVTFMNAELISHDLHLRIVPGADVRVDERIPALLKDNQLMTLADGGKYLLLELPHEIYLDLSRLLEELHDLNITAIISHPERNSYLLRHPHVVRPWLERGALLQVTAASLLGAYGPAIERAAWHFLEANLADLVATDAHNLAFRPPKMTEAFTAIAQRLNHPLARRVCIENPCRVLAGEQVKNLFPIQKEEVADE
jgi:protein-tyrosine phosphatase